MIYILTLVMHIILCLRKWIPFNSKELVGYPRSSRWVSHSRPTSSWFQALFSDITHHNCGAFLCIPLILLTVSSLQCSVCTGVPTWYPMHPYAYAYMHTYMSCILYYCRCVAVLFHPKKRKRVHVRNKYVEWTQLVKPSICCVITVPSFSRKYNS